MPMPHWLDPLGPDRMYITAADTVQSFSAMSQSRPLPVLVLGDEKQRDWDEETVPSGEGGSNHWQLGRASEWTPGRLWHCMRCSNRLTFARVREAASWEELLADGSRYQDLLGAAMEKHGLQNLSRARQQATANRRDYSPRRSLRSRLGTQSPAELAGDPYAQAMTQLVWDALRTELPDFPGGKLRLCDLDEADRLHELNFNFPLPHWRDLPCTAKSGTWEDCNALCTRRWPSVAFADPPAHTTGYLKWRHRPGVPRPPRARRSWYHGRLARGEEPELPLLRAGLEIQSSGK